MDSKKLIGILAIILGILIIVFPLVGTFALSIIMGVGFLLMGVHFLISGVSSWKLSRLASIIFLILGIIAVIFGVLLLGNVFLMSMVFSYFFWIIGFFLLFYGILGAFSRNTNHGIGISAVIVILAILTIILGYLAIINPVVIALLVGISLIIDGIAYLTSPEVVYKVL
jgi:uncharacterized membrane protein HdeD (DUF308 family)